MIEHANPSVGARLNRARVKAGLEIRQVAEQLHLLPKQIEALENDEFDQFGNELFCRGYIKSYCKLLAIDEQPVMDALSEELLNAPQTAKPKKPPSAIQRPAKGHSLQYWFVAATLLVALGLWLNKDSLEFDRGDSISAEAAVTAIESNQPPQIQSAVQQVFELAASQQPVQQDTVEIQEAQGDAENIDQAVPYQPADSEHLQQQQAAAALQFTAATPTPVQEPEPISVAQDIVATVVEKASDWLNFSFSDDCWVEVKDSEDAVLYANLKRADDTLSLTGKPPFRVLLGYAPGVSLDYNGEPVEIEVNRANNSARLTIGQL